MLPTFDKPEIFLQLVDLQYGQVIVGVVVCALELSGVCGSGGYSTIREFSIVLSL